MELGPKLRVARPGLPPGELADALQADLGTVDGALEAARCVPAPLLSHTPRQTAARRPSRWPRCGRAGVQARVRVLHVSGYNGVTVAAFEASSRGCPQLRKPDAGWCYGVTVAAIEALARGCPQLQKLDVNLEEPQQWHDSGT